MTTSVVRRGSNNNRKDEREFDGDVSDLFYASFFKRRKRLNVNENKITNSMRKTPAPPAVLLLFGRFKCYVSSNG